MDFGSETDLDALDKILYITMRNLRHVMNCRGFRPTDTLYADVCANTTFKTLVRTSVTLACLKQNIACIAATTGELTTDVNASDSDGEDEEAAATSSAKKTPVTFVSKNIDNLPHVGKTKTMWVKGSTTCSVLFIGCQARNGSFVDAAVPTNELKDDDVLIFIPSPSAIRRLQNETLRKTTTSMEDARKHIEGTCKEAGLQNVTVFWFNELLQWGPHNQSLVPFRKATAGEKREIRSGFRIDLERLPQMSTADPMSRLYGFQADDVVLSFKNKLLVDTLQPAELINKIKTEEVYPRRIVD